MTSALRTLSAPLLLLISVSPALASWQPPAGIPKPPFGVDQVRPAAPTVIVQSGQSIPNPVPAGAVVEIRGTYSKSHTGGSRVQCAGTASQPAFIYGAAGATVTGMWEVAGSYCIIEGLKFSGTAGTFVAPGDHLVLRDSEVVGTLNDGGFSIQSWSSAVLQYVVMLRNNIHHAGDVNASYDQDVHGTGLYRSSGTNGSIHHVWILDSEYSYCSGDGIQINANNDSTKLHHVYIGRVRAHHNKQGGIWSKRASDVVVSQNTVYAHRTSNSSLGHCVGYQYGPDRIWFLFNRLYDCEKGIMSGSDLGGADGTEAYAIGNVIHGLVAARNGGSAYTNAAIMIAGSQKWTIANNTFWNVPVGVASPYGGGEIRIEGNVFGPLNLADGSAIFLENSSRPYSVVGNVFERALFRLGGFSSTYGISRLPGNKEADPALVSPPTDCHLLAISPAVDYSPVSSAYARFLQLYGTSIQVDHDGVSRPLGGGVDAGAFEETSQVGGAPFGTFGTPANGSSGLTGSVAMSGWALDDVAVDGVSLYRSPVPGEATAANGKVYVGDATFVRGARPDVAAAYPDYPDADAAGWGYMLLSNLLPNGGNDTFTFYAYAIDSAGATTLLGAKTVGFSNASGTKPFGTLDTPAAGETLAGGTYRVWGWVLTPSPGVIPVNGSTITVFIDDVPSGRPTYNLYRADVAALFPSLANTDGAVGYYDLDTSTLSNGLHTIAWSATDNLGRTDGIGSRYFWVEK